MLLKVRYFVFEQMKEIVDCYGSRRVRWKHTIETVVMLAYLIRCVMVLMMLWYPERFPLYKYDYFAGYVWDNRKLCNQFVIMVMIMLILLLIRGSLTFFFSEVDTLPFQVLYDCLVYNNLQYHKSRLPDDEISKRIAIRQEYYRRRFNGRLPMQVCWALAWHDSWLQMERYRIDVRRFAENRMRMFPECTVEARLRLLRYSLMANLFVYFAHYFVAILICLGIYFLVDDFVGRLQSKWAIIVFAIDLAWVIDLIFIIFQISLLLNFAITIPTVIFLNHIINVNEILADICEKLRNPDGGGHFTKKILHRVQFVFREQYRLVYYVIDADKEKWSGSLYMYAMISIPMNACFLCIIIFEDLNWRELSLFTVIMMFHTITGLYPVSYLAHQFQQYVVTAKYIPPMQPFIGIRNLRIKLKLDDLFARLTDGSRYAFTFGYLGNTTWSGIFQGLLTYIAVFFMVVNSYRGG